MQKRMQKLSQTKLIKIIDRCERELSLFVRLLALTLGNTGGLAMHIYVQKRKEWFAEKHQ